MSTENFKAKYYVADGYVGGDRPHTFNISERDFEDNADEAYLREFYQESVQADFEQRLFPEAELEDEFVKWAQARIAAGNES
jgi:hypothetical protein